MGLVLLAVLFVAMWFFTIRPQQQRLRNQRMLVASLAVGDEVVTVGGLIGEITVLGDKEVRLDVGGTEVRLARNAINGKLAADAGTDAVPEIDDI
jgi:preprotein translocase subunit YajC